MGKGLEGQEQLLGLPWDLGIANPGMFWASCSFICGLSASIHLRAANGPSECLIPAAGGALALPPLPYHKY